MTRWKDLLPEYEPENGSWEKLEKNLHFDEQLQRELSNLPRHEPRDNSWDQIASRLNGRVRRLAMYYSAAAAAVLIIALSVIFFLLPSGPLSKNQYHRHATFRTPARDTASNRAVRAIGPENPLKRQDKIAGNAEQTLAVSSTPRKSQPVINSGRFKAAPAKITMDPQLKPKAKSQTIADRINLSGLPADSARLTITDPKQKTRHHRVIQVQWNVSKQTSLKIARVPDDASDKQKETSDHLIQIKL